MFLVQAEYTQDLYNKINAILHAYSKSRAYDKKINEKSYVRKPSLFLHFHRNGYLYLLVISRYAIFGASVLLFTTGPSEPKDEYTFKVSDKSLKTLYKWLSFIKNSYGGMYYPITLSKGKEDPSSLLVSVDNKMSVTIPLIDEDGDINYMHSVYKIGDKFPRDIKNTDVKYPAVRCSTFGPDLMATAFEFASKAIPDESRIVFRNDAIELCSVNESSMYFLHSSMNPAHEQKSLMYSVFAVIMPYYK